MSLARTRALPRSAPTSRPSPARGPAAALSGAVALAGAACFRAPLPPLPARRREPTEAGLFELARDQL